MLAKSALLIEQTFWLAAKTPPAIASGIAQTGAVPIPNTANTGPANPPIADPAAAKGTVAAHLCAPVRLPTYTNKLLLRFTRCR